MSQSTRVVRVQGSDSGLLDLSVLFDKYRRHYGQPPDELGSRAWLQARVLSGGLHCFLASDGVTSVGMAIAVSTPASVRLGHFWQLRDLYVDEGHRGRGVGRDLLANVCDAASADGALRVSIATEAENAAALHLYSSMGFEPVRGYVSMMLELPGPRRRE